jgi:hypothetical protein
MFAGFKSNSYLRLAAEIGRHQSSRTFGSSCLFSAPSFLPPVFSLSSNPPSSSLSPLPRCFLSASLHCTLSHPRRCPRVFHSRRWTRLPSRLSNSPACFYPRPHSDSAEPLPDMDIQAAKGSALVATPVSSLCQSSVFSAINMSVRYTIHKHEWKPYLT